ncbi:ABC transporter permease [Alkalihalobacillus trypoxylicola]|uniref:Transport permease protein n=1 Tax=Alkalihalobacillus trypoxylicola TaxID=519424 RepID=A0A161Q1M2_9BACI|nr:ABC transporter permease [Alkalihalobacillus trypoxylicola]KYG29403.1 ABC transporter permease [Alkalihalobacillus trypoxylicola]
MWAVAILETKKQLQDKSLVFWNVILPVVFVVGFMMIFSNDAPDTVAVANQIITGFSVFFAVFTIISIVITFVKDKDSGFVARMASTPLTVSGYFIGKIFPFVFIIVAQLVFLSLLGFVIYDVRIDQIFLYYFITLCLAFMVSSWGLGISVFSKTENTGIVLTQVIAFVGAILGGLWMPFEILPDIIQTIGKFFPQYWTHQALLFAVSETESVNLWIAFLVIAIYTIIGLGIALLGYRQFLRKSIR